MNCVGGTDTQPPRAGTRAVRTSFGGASSSAAVCGSGLGLASGLFIRDVSPSPHGKGCKGDRGGGGHLWHDLGQKETAVPHLVSDPQVWPWDVLSLFRVFWVG